MAALSLAAVLGLERELGIAGPADHLVALVLPGESSKRGLDLHGAHATASETEHQVESRLLLDVVVRESSTVFELLTGENQSLLIRRDALFVLDLGLDVLDGVSWLHIQCDRLAREGFDKNLHTLDKIIN